MLREYDYIIIGGGFFGCYIACALKQNRDASVIIIERESDLLQRASYNNQARIHRGYHYPRSISTGLSSSYNFERFVNEFKDCVCDSFKNYYAIARMRSKVAAFQYKIFCNRIGASLAPASEKVRSYFNTNLIEDVFLAQEYAFDAVKLRNIICEKLEKEKIPVLFNMEALSLAEEGGLALKVVLFNRETKNKFDIYGKHIFNCAYSNINTVLANSGISKIDLKQELTEMALVETPPQFKNMGITVMCGPFFSLMPFPPENLHALSHVAYTPHHYWRDREVDINNQVYFEDVPKSTNFAKMIQDAKRYVPLLAECRYADSLWELKTVLPQSEIDDGRPILFKKDTGVKNLFCVMGGKMDNIYDLEEELKKLA